MPQPAIEALLMVGEKKSGGSHGSDNALREVRKTYGPGCTGISDDQLVTFGIAYLKEILEPDPRYTGW